MWNKRLYRLGGEPHYSSLKIYNSKQTFRLLNLKMKDKRERKKRRGTFAETHHKMLKNLFAVMCEWAVLQHIYVYSKYEKYSSSVPSGFCSHVIG